MINASFGQQNDQKFIFSPVVPQYTLKESINTPRGFELSWLFLIQHPSNEDP